jgi:transposase
MPATSIVLATLAHGWELVPRQFTTGGKSRLLGITKRGNVHLRTLLVHGARAAMQSLSQSDTLIGRWLRALLSRSVHRNRDCALANKLARTAWAILRTEQPTYGAVSE